MGHSPPLAPRCERGNPLSKRTHNDHGPVRDADTQIPLCMLHIAQAFLLSSYGVSAPILGWECGTALEWGAD